MSSISSFRNVSFSDLQTLNQISNSTSKELSFSQIFDDAIKNKDEDSLKNACVEFESYFLNMMFKSMRSTIINGTEKSNAEEIFQEMLDQQICQNIAETRGIGFADMIYSQISKNI